MKGTTMTSTTHRTIWFDRKENEWLSNDGQPVCQDHGDPLASCSYHGKTLKRHVDDMRRHQHNDAECEWCASAS